MEIGGIALSELAGRRHLWFQQFADRFKVRYGTDPVQVVRDVEMADRRRRNWLITLFATSAVIYIGGLVIVATVNASTHPADATKMWMVFGLLGAMTTCIVVGFFGMKRLPKGFDLYPDEQRLYFYRLSDLFAWAGSTPNNLSPDADWTHLRLMAEDVLIQSALVVVTLEHIPFAKRDREWVENYDRADKVMRHRHPSMKSIGLADAKYDRYYHEAERIYEAKEARRLREVAQRPKVE